ncbi:hypothetical protein GF377_01390 [candidate division GN15 bacterium]|nr:hypothetical protein [candidate division GN15 bacterium]
MRVPRYDSHHDLSLARLHLTPILGSKSWRIQGMRCIHRSHPQEFTMGFLRALTLLFCLALFIPAVSPAAETPDMQVRVQIDDKAAIQDLYELHLDIVYRGAEFLDIFVTPDQLTELEAAGFKVEVIHESVSEFYQSRLDQSKEMGGYKTLSEINAYIDSVIAEHPSIVSNKVQIGTTHEGRPMWAFKISDNPEVDEEEPEVMYTAAIHAREVITPLVIRNYVEHITNNYGIDPDITDLVDNREIWIVMCVNPDGYYHNEVIAPSGGGMWRKNRRDNGNGTYGVDLNRNFGYEWGYDNGGSSPDPADLTYRGPAPFSEPETQAMRDFAIAHEFVITIYFHSYSNLVLYPWGYDYFLTPDNDIFSVLADSCALWNGYDPGPAHGLYPANGVTDDWHYGEQTLKNLNFSMTFEVGGFSDGFWPDPARIPALVGENLEPLMFLTRIADNVYQLRVPEAPVMALPPSAPGVEYTVEWTHDDTLNPAVAYELVEMQGPVFGTNPADNLDGWSDEGFLLTSNRANSAPTSYYSDSGNGLLNRLSTESPYEVQSGDTLRFWTYYDIESNWDYGYVEVSTDGQAWESIAGSITTDYDPHGANLGNGVTGSSGGWVEAVFDLSAYEGEQIFVRFTYDTDGSVVEEGWYIDDISPYATFESITVVSSSITGTSYTFTNKPGGEYYYRVRALDAEDQWSLFSETEQMTVLDAVTGDIDLDGIAASPADAALFHAFFEEGMGVFDINLEEQIAQTDVDCDGLTLTQSDLDYILLLLRELTVPCIPPGKTGGATSAPLGTKDDPAYSIRLTSPELYGQETFYVDIELTEGNEPVLGFQLKLEYNTDELSLFQAEAGPELAGWDHLEYSDVVNENNPGHRVVCIGGLAWLTSDSTTQSETDPQPTPKTLVRLQFQVNDAENPLTSDINFIWERCSDNTIATGAWPGPTSEVLTLSNAVYDADLVDITGSDPLYGGRASHCDNGYLGAGPMTGIDFTSGRVTYDPSCCVGDAGNIDCDPTDASTLGDLTSLIDHLFISLSPLCCEDEAVLDANPEVTLGDLTALVDHLFISLGPLPACP